jgi:hypothetical protein
MELISERPGQKQTGIAGHAPSPSIPTCTDAERRLVRKPLLLSRPTFLGSKPDLLRLLRRTLKVMPL